MSEEVKEVGAVRAKMVCGAMSQIDYQHSSVKKVELGAVCGKEGENADFTKYTPSGSCWMNIESTAAAASFFKPGKKYYVTFTEAPD